MAEEMYVSERILKGRMEDHTGRILHSETESGQVMMADGKTVEEKVAELLAALGGYVSKSGSSVIRGGNLGVENGYVSSARWLCMSAGSDGHAMYAQNAYKNPDNNKYYFLNTHESMGARGIILRHGSPGIWWFDTGMRETTADEEFTPTFKRLDKPDAEMATGRDFNSLLENGVYCGAGMQNAPFGSSDWFYIFVQNLTDNSTNYVTQWAVAVNQQATYQRGRRAGNWDAWQRISTVVGDGNSSFLQIPAAGPESGRGGYVGFPDSGNMMYLTNEKGGPVNVSASGGLMVNGTRVPTQHISTAIPQNSQGVDGDTWDVYI